jgi:hypothetical protein
LHAPRSAAIVADAGTQLEPLRQSIRGSGNLAALNHIQLLGSDPDRVAPGRVTDAIRAHQSFDRTHPHARSVIF